MARLRVTFVAALVSILLLASVAARSEAEIRALTGIIEGHEVGGMAVDWTGSIYSSDLGDVVWRLTPEGERREFATLDTAIVCSVTSARPRGAGTFCQCAPRD